MALGITFKNQRGKKKQLPEKEKRENTFGEMLPNFAHLKIDYCCYPYLSTLSGFCRTIRIGTILISFDCFVTQAHKNNVENLLSDVCGSSVAQDQIHMIT